MSLMTLDEGAVRKGVALEIPVADDYFVSANTTACLILIAPPNFVDCLILHRQASLEAESHGTLAFAGRFAPTSQR